MIKQQDVTTRRYDNFLFDFLSTINQHDSHSSNAITTAKQTSPQFLSTIGAKSPPKVEKYSI
jgi:hypothetical protein